MATYWTHRPWLKDGETVGLFIQPGGAEVRLLLAHGGGGFTAERRVNGRWQEVRPETSANTAEAVLRDWRDFELKIGSRVTTDAFESSHCPFCGHERDADLQPGVGG